MVTSGYGPIWLDTAVHLWFDRIIRSTPYGPHAMAVHALYGPHTGIFIVFHILRNPYRACAGPARMPYGTIIDTLGNWHSQNLQKSHTGPSRFLHGRFMGCLRYLNPYGAGKLIMHALKLYGPGTVRQNSYGATRGLYRPVSPRTFFVQNSPGTARMGPRSVMWLGHKTQCRQPAYLFYLLMWPYVC